MTDKKWCEHVIGDECCAPDHGIHFIGKSWKLCPICGTPRPQEKKVELPEKIHIGLTSLFGNYNLEVRINQLIDYLASKPWENK